MTINELHDLLTHCIRAGDGDQEIRVWLPGATVSIDGRVLDNQKRVTFKSKKLYPGMVLIEGNMWHTRDTRRR